MCGTKRQGFDCRQTCAYWLHAISVLISRTGPMMCSEVQRPLPCSDAPVLRRGNRCTCMCTLPWPPHLWSLSQFDSGGVIGVEQCTSYCLPSSLTHGVFCGKIMIGTVQLQALRHRMRPADTCWRRPAFGLGRCLRLRVLSTPTGCAAGCAGQLTDACLHQPCPCDRTTSAAHVHRS